MDNFKFYNNLLNYQKEKFKAKFIEFHLTENEGTLITLIEDVKTKSYSIIEDIKHLISYEFDIPETEFSVNSENIFKEKTELKKEKNQLKIILKFVF